MKKKIITLGFKAKPPGVTMLANSRKHSYKATIEKIFNDWTTRVVSKEAKSAEKPFLLLDFNGIVGK